MENLKKFIDNNRVAFEVEELSEGHRARFAGQARRSHSHSLLSKVIGIAAALILIIGTTFFMHKMSVDPMAQIEAEIALYGVTVTQISNEIMTLCQTNGTDIDEIRLIIEQVHSDAIPIFQQLPEELSPAEKAYILKRYYNQKIMALRQIYAQVETIDQ